MAEAVFKDTVKKENMMDRFGIIDSCGTADYHEGEEPHSTTVRVCMKNNVPIKHQARAIQNEDFNKFHYIFGMDTNNVRNLTKIQPKGSKAKVMLFSAFDDNGTVFDPYFIGDSAFYTVFEQCQRYSKAFLSSILRGSNAQL